MLPISTRNPLKQKTIGLKINFFLNVKSFSALLLCFILVFQGIPDGLGEATAAIEISDSSTLPAQSEQTPSENSEQLFITEKYDPAAVRLVVEKTQNTDLDTLAEAVGGELVRTGPLDYCTLQFEGTKDTNEAADILQKTLQVPGVLNASWSKKYQTEGVADTKVFTTAVSDPEYSYQWGCKG